MSKRTKSWSDAIIKKLEPPHKWQLQRDRVKRRAVKKKELTDAIHVVRKYMEDGHICPICRSEYLRGEDDG